MWYTCLCTTRERESTCSSTGTGRPEDLALCLWKSGDEYLRKLHSAEMRETSGNGAQFVIHTISNTIRLSKSNNVNHQCAVP